MRVSSSARRKNHEVGSSHLSACTSVGCLRVNVNNDLHSPATISNCAMRVVGGLERELLRIHDGYHLAGTREQGGFAQNLPVMFSTNTGE
jgi:hypothetical protein